MFRRFLASLRPVSSSRMISLLYHLFMVLEFQALEQLWFKLVWQL
jgi:hypothetical protein